jgi:hypothetical protein
VSNCRESESMWLCAVGEGRKKLERNLIRRIYPKSWTDCTSLYSRISVIMLVHDWRVVRVFSDSIY